MNIRRFHWIPARGENSAILAGSPRNRLKPLENSSICCAAGAIFVGFSTYHSRFGRIFDRIRDGHTDQTLARPPLALHELHRWPTSVLSPTVITAALAPPDRRACATALASPPSAPRHRQQSPSSHVRHPTSQPAATSQQPRPTGIDGVRASHAPSLPLALRSALPSVPRQHVELLPCKSKRVSATLLSSGAYSTLPRTSTEAAPQTAAKGHSRF